MATIYRIALDKEGNLRLDQSGILYSGDDPSELAPRLHNVNYKFVKSEKKISVGELDLTGLTIGTEDKPLAVNTVVVANYTDAKAFQTFLEGFAIRRVTLTPPVPFRNKFIHFITRPGTWTFVALALVLAGIFAPVAAVPGLIVAAAVTTGLAALSLFRSISEYAKDFWTRHHITDSEEDKIKKTFSNFIQFAWADLKKWASEHPVQAAIVVGAVALLATTLTLTIGFFTGGAAFVFMAPVFATIAAPFATAAAAAVGAGAWVNLAALAGASFILAGLSVPDVLRRFTDWLDGLKGTAGNQQGVIPAAPEKIGESLDNIEDVPVDNKFTLKQEPVPPPANAFDAAIEYLRQWRASVKGGIFGISPVFYSVPRQKGNIEELGHVLPKNNQPEDNDKDINMDIT